MHLWTYTGSQSCCSGRRPSYKHKPRREQREAQMLQPCQTQPMLFTPNKHPTFTGIFKFPSAIYQVIFRLHRHLPFLLFLERLCTLPSLDRYQNSSETSPVPPGCSPQTTRSRTGPCRARGCNTGAEGTAAPASRPSRQSDAADQQPAGPDTDNGVWRTAGAQGLPALQHLFKLITWIFLCTGASG